MEDKTNIYMKIELYIMSLWLLFLLIFLLTVKSPLNNKSKFIGFIPLFKQNIVSIVALIFIVIGFILTKKFNYKWKGAVQPSVKILNVKNENYEYLTFLTTYIIPFACIDLSNIRYIIVLALLLIIIGDIFVKMDLYLGNPTLALLGYHLYKITTNSQNLQEELIVITKDKLEIGDDIEWIKIDKSTLYVRRWKSE